MQIGATSRRNYNVKAFTELSTKTPVRGYSWFWSIPVSEKLFWVYIVLNKTLNILPLGLLCQKQTQMWILWYISAFLLTAHVLGSLSAAVTSSQWTPSHCLWEKSMCNKPGSHWSHRIISRLYIIIPSELFLQASWTVSVNFAILILFSKCRQCTKSVLKLQSAITLEKPWKPTSILLFYFTYSSPYFEHKSLGRFGKADWETLSMYLCCVLQTLKPYYFYFPPCHTKVATQAFWSAVFHTCSHTTAHTQTFGTFCLQKYSTGKFQHAYA